MVYLKRMKLSETILSGRTARRIWGVELKGQCEEASGVLLPLVAIELKWCLRGCQISPRLGRHFRLLSCHFLRQIWAFIETDNARPRPYLPFIVSRHH